MPVMSPNKAEDHRFRFEFLGGDRAAVSPAEAPERLAAVLLEQGNKAFG